VHTARPNYGPDLSGLGQILILVVWTMLSLVEKALERMR
jgi:hypothetical protein